MLTIDYEIIDEQFCICRFAFSENETNKLRNEEKYLDLISEKIDEYLFDKGIYPVNKKNTKLLSNIKLDKKILGVARFPILSEIRSISLPQDLTIDFAGTEIEELKANVFNDYLLDNDLSYEEESNRVKENSKVYITTEVIANGELTKSFDVIVEPRRSKRKYHIGKTVGDRNFVCCDIVGADHYETINKIVDSYPYTIDKYEPDILYKKTGYRSFSEFKKYYYTLADLYYKLFLYKCIITDRIVENSDFTMSQDLIDYYYYKVLPRNDEYGMPIKNDTFHEYKCEYFLDIFDKMVVLNNDIIIKDFANVNLNNIIDEFIKYQLIYKGYIDQTIKYFHVVGFCYKNGIIKNFKELQQVFQGYYNKK